MRKSLIYALALLIALVPLLGSFTNEASAVSSRVAIIKELKGTVKVKKSGGSKEFTAFAKMSLNEGDVLAVSSGGSAVLQFSNGTSEDDRMTVAENTKLTFSKLSSKKGTTTKVSMWSGSAWVDVKSIANADDQFSLETPTAVMGVRGTHLLVNVDPVTGATRLTVAAGIVQTATKDGNQKTRDVYPTQNALITGDENAASQSDITIAQTDLELLVQQSDASIIAAILRSAEEITRENEEYSQRFENDLPPEIGQNQADLERFKSNAENLLGAIADQAVKSGLLSAERLAQIVEEVKNQTGFEIDLEKKTLTTTDEDEQKKAKQREAEEEAKRLAEEKRAKEQKEREQQAELLRKLEAERTAAEKAKRAAEEEKRRKAEEELKQKLSDEEKARFEAEKQQREREQSGATPTPTSTPTPAPVNPNPPAPTPTPSSNANLASLSISSNGESIALSPTFAAATTSYTATYPALATNVIVTPVVQDTGKATVKVNGSSLSGGSSTISVIGVDELMITITVTAENGSTKSYTVALTREISHAADLGSLEVTTASSSESLVDVNLPDADAPNRYTIHVSNTTGAVIVKPIAIDETAAIHVQGQQLASGAGIPVPLAALGESGSGSTTEITIAVTIPTGLTKLYTVVVNRAASLLTGIVTIPGIDNFDPGQAAYVLEPLPNDVNNLPLHFGTLADGVQVAVENNGDPVYANDDGYYNVELAPGSNEIVITVTSPGLAWAASLTDLPMLGAIANPGGIRQTYTIHVTRGLSSDTSLNELKVNDVVLSAVSDVKYVSTVAYNTLTAIIKVSANKSSEGATAVVKRGSDIVSGNQSLAIGLNTFSIVVTAPDGTVKTYTLEITREASDDTSLTVVNVNGTVLTADLDGNYAKTVASSVNDALIQAVPTKISEGATAVVKRGGVVVSGSQSLIVGVNTFEIEVTAPNTTTKKTYTLVITREASDDTSLSVVNVNGTVLTADLDGNYAKTVDYSVNDALIQAVPTKVDEEATAVVKRGGVVVSGSQSLNVGVNTFEIEVTAPNTTTKKTYTLVITREASDDTSLSVVNVNGSVLTADLDGNYTKTVDYSVNSALIQAVPTKISEGATAVVKCGGIVVSGSQSLNVGVNTFEIEVTAPNTTTKKTYTLVITREASDDTSLSVVNVNGTVLTADLDGNYTKTVDYSVNSALIQAVPTKVVEEATAVVKRGGVVVSGSQSLIVGVNTFEIEVTAPNTTTKKTYTLVITREASDDTSLAFVKVNSETLTYSNNAYMITVPFATEFPQLEIVPTKSGEGATFVLKKGESVVVGDPYLVVGPNAFVIEVTAPDHTTKNSYTLFITRAAGSSEANFIGYSIGSHKQTRAAYIDSESFTVDIEVWAEVWGDIWESVDPAELYAYFELSPGATAKVVQGEDYIDVESGELIDPTQPIIYQIRSENGHYEYWTVIVHPPYPLHYVSFYYGAEGWTEAAQIDELTFVAHLKPSALGAYGFTIYPEVYMEGGTEPRIYWSVDGDKVDIPEGYVELPLEGELVEEGWYDFIIEVSEGEYSVPTQYSLQLWIGEDLPTVFNGLEFQSEDLNISGVSHHDPSMLFMELDEESLEVSLEDSKYTIRVKPTNLPAGATIESIMRYSDDYILEQMEVDEDGYYTIRAEWLPISVYVTLSAEQRKWPFEIRLISDTDSQLYGLYVYKLLEEWFENVDFIPFQDNDQAGYIVLDQLEEQLYFRPEVDNDSYYTKLEIDDQEIEGSEGRDWWELPVFTGEKSVVIRVTSPSGKFVREYTLNLYSESALPNSVAIESISGTSGPSSTEFTLTKESTGHYQGEIPNDDSFAILRITLADENAVVTDFNRLYHDGSEIVPEPWGISQDNDDVYVTQEFHLNSVEYTQTTGFQFNVEGPNGLAFSYQVSLVKDSANLRYIRIDEAGENGGIQVVDYTGDTMVYTLNEPKQLNAYVNAAYGAAVYVNDVLVPSREFPIDYANATQTFEIMVVSPRGGETKHYTFVVKPNVSQPLSALNLKYESEDELLVSQLGEYEYSAILETDKLSEGVAYVTATSISPAYTPIAYVGEAASGNELTVDDGQFIIDPAYLEEGWNTIVIRSFDASDVQVGNDTVIQLWYQGYNEQTVPSELALDIESLILFDGDSQPVGNVTNVDALTYNLYADSVATGLYFAPDLEEEDSRITTVVYVPSVGESQWLTSQSGVFGPFDFVVGGRLIVYTDDQAGHQLAYTFNMQEYPRLADLKVHYTAGYGWNTVTIGNRMEHYIGVDQLIPVGTPYLPLGLEAMPVSEDQSIEVYVGGTSLNPTNDKYPFTYYGDPMIIDIVVKSADGLSSHSYELEIRPHARNDASIRNLQVDYDYLGNATSSKDYYYLVHSEQTELNDVKFSIPTLASKTVELNGSTSGVTYNSANKSYDFTFTGTTNVIQIVVTAEAGNTEQYNIHLIRDNDPSNLVLDSVRVIYDQTVNNVTGTYLPAIKAYRFNTNVNLGPEYTSYKVKPERGANSNGTRIEVETDQGTTVEADGQGEYVIDMLHYGWNIAYIKVYSPDDKVHRQHEVPVWRGGDFELWDASGATLLGSASQIAPGDNARTFIVPMDTTSVKFKALLNTPDARLNAAGVSEFASDTLSGEIAFTESEKTIQFWISQTWGQSFIYTVTLQREEPSYDTTLSDLTVNEQSIDGFDPYESMYEITVPNGVQSVVIGGTTTNSQATVEGFRKYDNLAVGDNEVVIIVSANGMSSYYYLNIYRESVLLPESLDLLELKIGEEDQPLKFRYEDEYDSDGQHFIVRRYAAELPSGTDSIDFKIALGDIESEDYVPRIESNHTYGEDEDPFYRELETMYTETVTVSGMSDGYHVFELSYEAESGDRIRVEIALLIGPSDGEEDLDAYGIYFEDTQYREIVLTGGDTYYTADVDVDVDRAITFLYPSEWMNYGRIWLNGAEIDRGVFEISLPLQVGLNTIKYRVYNPIGSKYKEYLFEITRAPGFELLNEDNEPIGYIGLHRMETVRTVMVPTNGSTIKLRSMLPTELTLEGQVPDGEGIYTIALTDGFGSVNVSWQDGEMTTSHELRFSPAPLGGQLDMILRAYVGNDLVTIPYQHALVEGEHAYYALVAEDMMYLNLGLQSEYGYEVYEKYSEDPLYGGEMGYPLYLAPGLNEYTIRVVDTAEIEHEIRLFIIRGDEDELLYTLDDYYYVRAKGVSYAGMTYYLVDPDTTNLVYYPLMGDEGAKQIFTVMNVPNYVEYSYTETTDTLGRTIIRNPLVIYSWIPDSLKVIPNVGFVDPSTSDTVLPMVGTLEDMPGWTVEVNASTFSLSFDDAYPDDDTFFLVLDEMGEVLPQADWATISSTSRRTLTVVVWDGMHTIAYRLYIDGPSS